MNVFVKVFLLEDGIERQVNRLKISLCENGVLTNMVQEVVLNISVLSRYSATLIRKHEKEFDEFCDVLTNWGETFVVEKEKYEVVFSTNGLVEIPSNSIPSDGTESSVVADNNDSVSQVFETVENEDAHFSTFDKEIFTNSAGTGFLDIWVRNHRIRAKKTNPNITVRSRKRKRPLPITSLDSKTADEMIARMNRTPLQNKQEIKQLHEQTMVYRRNWITKALQNDDRLSKGIATEILERYRHMLEINELIKMDFDFVIETNFPNWKLSEDFSADWDNLWSSKIIQWALTNPPKQSQIFESISAVPLKDMNSDEKSLNALKLLPEILKHSVGRGNVSDLQLMYCEISNTVDPNKAIVYIKDELKMSQPLILRLGSDEFSQFYIVVDRKLVTVEGNITRAIELLIECFYVFEVDYPKRLFNVFRFIEHIFGLKSLPQTAGVLSFVENLKSFV